MMTDEVQTILEAEVIYGAINRERFWKMAFAGMAAVAATSMVIASVVAMSVQPAAPVVVPFDPTTGMAVPNANIRSVSLDERPAVIQSLIFQYVNDRETYNQIDNDIRINRALDRSQGAAKSGLVNLWDSSSSDFLPTRYGDKTSVNVTITGITLLGEDRVQIRMRKRLESPDGVSIGNFTAVAGFEFTAGEETTLEAVWQNPLGFTVNEYSLYQDRRE